MQIIITGYLGKVLGGSIAKESSSDKVELNVREDGSTPQTTNLANIYKISGALTTHMQMTLWISADIREYGSTLYIGLSRFPHRANTNRFRCNSLVSEHFCSKF